MNWMTVREAAEYMRVSKQTVRRWMMRGLPHYQPVKGGRVLINKADVDKWIAG